MVKEHELNAKNYPSEKVALIVGKVFHIVRRNQNGYQAEIYVFNFKDLR